ncbi:hypothetical protein [Streptomyces sp. Ac-502]|uniref:hypothetical protein n=1 Tax=Streptomyces sp. Ac-502 TaxID=3342801 RepID=UPI00386229FB
MSQWNLSVRLSGQGSDLVTTLRRASTEARKLQRDIAAARREITQLRQAARSPIRIGVTVDARNLRREVQQAARGAGGQRITIPLSIDGRGLRQQVRTALASAGTGNRLRVPLTVDASRIRQEVRRAVTAAGAGNRITIPLHVDGDRFAASLQRATTQAAAGLDRLRDAAQNTSHALSSLQRHAREAGQELGDLRTQAVTAAAGLRSVNTAAGRADGRLDTLSTRSRTLRTDLDSLDGSVQRVGGSLGGLRGSIGRVGSSSQSTSMSVRSLLGLLVALSTAAVPVAASTVAVAASLSATAAAAGASATAFGIALAGQVGALGDAADAQKKYDEAVRDHGAASKEAGEAQMALQRQLAAMPAPTRQASAALSSLKTQYQDWSDSLAGDTMPVAVKGFQTLSAVIPKLTPLVKSAAAQFDRLITLTAGGINSGSFDRLFAEFDQFAAGSLDKVIDGLVHLMRVLSGGAPPGSAALRSFMDYARSVGPQVGDTLTNLGQALLHLLEASSEAGVTMLTLVNALAQLVNAVPAGAISAFIQMYAALKLVQLGMAGITAVASSQAIARIGHFLAVVRAGGLSTAATGLVGGMSAMSKAVGIAAAAFAAFYAGQKIGEAFWKQTPYNAEQMTRAFTELSTTGRLAGVDMGRLADSFQRVQDASLADTIYDYGTFHSNEEWKKASGDLESFDAKLASLVKNGNPKLAAQGFTMLSNALKKQGYSTAEIQKALPEYTSALADAKEEQKLAAAAMGLFGEQAQQTSAKLQAQKASADGLRQAIQELNNAQQQGLGGMIGFEAAIDAAADAAKKNAGALTMTGGQLNLNSEKARNAATALNDLAAKTDEAAASARQANAPWETINGIYQRGRNQLVASAMQMGLTSAQAKALAASILTIPDKKSTQIEMKREDALAGLQSVQAELAKTKSKTVTVDALTQVAEDNLVALGFKVTHLEDGRVQVTAETAGARANLDTLISQIRAMPGGKTIAMAAATGGAIRDLQNLKSAVQQQRGKTITMNVPTAEGRRQLELLGYKIQSTKGKQVTVSVPTGGPRASVSAIQAAINSLQGRQVTVSIFKTTYVDEVKRNTYGPYADGYRYGRARGGPVPGYASGGDVQMYPAGGYVRGPGSDTSDSILTLMSAGPVRLSDREYVIRAAAVRRYGLPFLDAVNKGKYPGFADGGAVPGFASGGVTDWRYDPTSGSLYSPSDAGSAAHKTKKVKGKEVQYFDLGALESKLRSSSKATAAWSKDLETVADRVGSDVADALASMGQDGVALTKKMANGSAKYINEMAANLRGLAKTARASLTDYTRQLNAANKVDAAFAADLAKLSAAGYGDLAKQLAAQNDKAAQELAAAAVKDRKKASSANSAAKTANNALTSEQVAQLVQIIAAISKSTTGIHDVAAATGLGEDDIVAVATKARSQISSSLGGRATRFLSDLGKAQKGLAYANGGIRPGIYGTKAGAVTFAEPATGGEAYIPLGANKRRSATAVLGDVAGRFGLGLQDAGSRVVIIREQGPLVGTQTFQISSGGTATDTARAVESRTAYQLRRLARGGAR